MIRRIYFFLKQETISFMKIAKSGIEIQKVQTRIWTTYAMQVLLPFLGISKWWSQRDQHKAGTDSTIIFLRILQDSQTLLQFHHYLGHGWPLSWRWRYTGYCQLNRFPNRTIVNVQSYFWVNCVLDFSFLKHWNNPFDDMGFVLSFCYCWLTSDNFK